MKNRVGKDERRERLANTLKCWNEFVEKFFVGKRNFLFPGRDEGERIFSKETIDRVKAVDLDYGVLGGFYESDLVKFASAGDFAKILFSHAVFVYELIITSKNKGVALKQRDIDCFNLGGFLGSDHIYLDGCSGIGNYLTVNKKPAIEYVLRLFEHLAEQPDLAVVSDFNQAIKLFCEKEYSANKGGIVDSMSSVILWYAAPDEYEPISAQSEKKNIASHFAHLIKDEPEYSADMLTDNFKVNKALRMIRQKLEAERGEKISFYDSDVEIQWKVEKQGSNERKFRVWMKEVKGLEDRTIGGYISALKSKLSKIAKENGLIDGGTLLDIQLESEFEGMRSELETNQKFVEIDAKSRKLYSNALGRYGEYLAHKEGAPKNGGNAVTESQKTKEQRPLNQIFYGPPGTGKTYGVVEAALKIIGGEMPVAREGQMKRFNELLDAGQIEIVTFHQNFSYEDFIEGIKPVLDSEENDLSYEMSAGIFKRIAAAANKNRKDSVDAGRRSDVDGLVNEYARYVEHSDGDIFIDDKGKWKIERVTRYSNEEFRSFYILRANTNAKSGQRLTLEMIEEHYENFEKKKIKSPADIPPKFTSQSMQHGNAPYYFAFFQKLKEFKESRGISFSKESVERKNYVLIIDEINRGNISAIFGELITLLEDDKRLGKGNVNALELTLPYSKEKFGVPDNLHIIGTMNTADRSIAMLDTALRRRFHFVEMMPKPELLSEDVGGVNCRLLLEKINARIKAEYDREHQIGHAFLMGVEGIEDLKDKFQHKIIPLLQEYFFDDWEKIAKVLNKNRFIREEKQESEDADKKLFELLPFGDEAWDKAENYQEIYKKKNLQADDE